MRILFKNIFLTYFYKLLIVLSILAIFACKNRNLPSGLRLSGDLNQQALIQFTDSIAKVMNNNPVHVFALFDSVIEISASQKFNDALMNVLYQSARYKNRSGDFSGAYDNLQRAYQLTGTDATEITTLILIEMAESQQLMVHYPVADSLLQVAETLANKNPSAHHLAAIHNTAANIENGRGNLLKATDLYLKAAGHYAEILDSANLAVVHENIGLIYRQSGNYDKAFEYIRKSYLINQSLSDTGRLALNLNNLGVLYRETNQPDSAIAFYQKSLNLYRWLNSQRGLATSYMNIANVLTEKTDFGRATDYFDSSLLVIRQMGSDYGFLLEQINRANLFMKKGETKKAIPMLEAALDECRKMQLISENAEVLKMLYEAWLAEGNHKNALFYFTNYHIITDSLRSADIQQKLAGAQNDFEIKNREVKLLQLENSLSAAAAKSRNQRHFFVAVVIFFILIALILFYRKRSVEMQVALIKEKLDNTLANLEIKHRELLNHAKQLSLMKEYTEKLEKDKEDFNITTVPGNTENPLFLTNKTALIPQVKR